MLQKQYVPPTLNKDFHCPHCHTFAQQTWGEVSLTNRMAEDFTALRCGRCRKFTIWYKGQLIFPFTSIAPLPSDDMPEDVKADYEEARQLMSISPRASAALLRLAVQKLMPHLGESGENINDDIASLVKKGLLPRVQQSLDALRVIGNSAVHPGQIDLQDNQVVASALFAALNVIVESMITYNKQAEELYSVLPQTSKDAIDKRDKGKK